MRIKNKFWRIARRLQTEQLQRRSRDDFSFDDADLFNLDIGQRGGKFFLGYYSDEGINLALQKYGVFKELKKLGFDDVKIYIDTSDTFKHKVSCYSGQRSPQNMLIELVLRKQYFDVNLPFENNVQGRSFQALVIDWLCMQDPRAKFTKKRPQLPGQNYPGLGMSSIIVELLLIICWRLNLSALMNIPEHYHNAVFYSKAFHYLDPENEARFIALKESFPEMSLYDLTWAVERGEIVNVATGEPFKWVVGEQIVPLKRILSDVFSGKDYKKFVLEKKRWYRFRKLTA